MYPARRTAKLVAVGVVVAFLASAGFGTVVGNPLMSTEQTQQTVEQFVAALASGGDYEVHLSDDIVLSISGVPGEISGFEAANAAIDALHNEQFRSSIELNGMIVGPGYAALEATFIGTHSAEFAGMPATGAPVTVAYGVFYELADNKIVAIHVYGLFEGLGEQVRASTSTVPWGAPPAPGRPGANY